MTKTRDLADLGGGFIQAGTGATQRTVEDKLKDVVSVKDFGAVGDGTTDDTSAIQAFFNHLAANGGSGYVNPGTYKLTTSIVLISPAKGFCVFGAGDVSRLQFRAGSDQNILNVRSGTGITVENILLDCGYSVTGFANHGYSFRDPNNVVMRNVNVIDHRGAAGLMFLDTATATATNDNLNGEYRNCYIIDSYSDSKGNGQNGFLLEGMYASAIVNCHVAPLDRTGSPVLGLQLKNICRYSSIIGGSAEGCLAGVALGGDGAGAGAAGHYCRVDGVVVKDCQSGVALSKTVDCTVDIAVDMASNASNVYGVEVAGNNTGATINATVSNIPASKYAVRIGSDRTNVDLSIPTAIGTGLVALFDAGVDNSSLNLRYNSTCGQSGNNLLSSLITDNSGSSANSVRYLPATGGNGLTNAASYQFNTVLGGQSYIAYNGATPQVNIRMSGTDHLNLHPNWLSPVSDNLKTLGRAVSRWSTVYAGTGTINTSDERSKQDIEALSDAELRVATALKSLVKKFRFKDAVQAKADDARIHVGVIAQEVIAAFQAEGLDPMRYGIVCYDQWEAELDDEGNEIIPAGDRYGVRYEELLAFIIAAL